MAWLVGGQSTCGSVLEQDTETQFAYDGSSISVRVFIAPDEQPVNCMVTSRTRTAFVNWRLPTCVVKHFEWLLRLEIPSIYRYSTTNLWHRRGDYNHISHVVGY